MKIDNVTPEHFVIRKQEELQLAVQSLDEMARLFALLKELYDMTDENKKVFEKYGVEYQP